MTNDRLERDLRQFLVARDPGPAPLSIQVAVRAVPDATPPSGMGGFLRRALPPLAAAAVFVVLVTVLASIRLGSFDGAGATPSPSTEIGTLQPGDGLVTVEPPLGIALVAAAAVIALVAITNRIRRGYRRVIQTGLALVVVGAVLTISNIDALSGSVSMATPNAPLTDPADGSDIFAVGPNTTIPIGVWVTNSSSLPITILGLAQDPVATSVPTLPGPVAIGRFKDPDVIDPREPLPFAPITLQPHELTPLAFLIATGNCAATTNTENYFDVAHIQVAYDVLGIQKTSTLFLGSPIRIPLTNGCGN
jgi:hypothetical protein